MSEIAQFPHCDQRILHAPSECEFCDGHPEWQELRKAWGIAFTGYRPRITLPECGKKVSRPGLAFSCRQARGHDGDCLPVLEHEALPCPADAARPPGSGSDHRRWGGNKPTSAKGNPSWPAETAASRMMYGDMGRQGSRAQELRVPAEDHSCPSRRPGAVPGPEAVRRGSLAVVGRSRSCLGHGGVPGRRGRDRVRRARHMGAAVKPGVRPGERTAVSDACEYSPRGGRCREPGAGELRAHMNFGQRGPWTMCSGHLKPEAHPADLHDKLFSWTGQGRDG